MTFSPVGLDWGVQVIYQGVIDMEGNLHILQEYITLLGDNDLLREINISAEVAGSRVRYISYDSQDIEYNTLFVCKGAHFKPEYLADAMGKGAFAYVGEEKMPVVAEGVTRDVPYIIVKDVRKAMALIADLYYNQVWKKITLVGITGTKGKSSSAYFMKYILDDYLKEQKKPASAIISSIDNYDGIISEESHLTTPEAIMFHKHMDNAVKSDIEYLTMEVSSQALKYHRTMGVTYDVGCFLNLGEDHISDVEHSDFADYGNAKKMLFNQCKIAVVNLDSSFSGEILKTAEASPTVEKVITFGIDLSSKADMVAYEIRPGKRSIDFRVKCDSFDEDFRIGMTGLFNVSNALATIAMSYGLNIPLDNIKAGLKKAKVSGRMEIFTNKEETITVLVDYAHNQMSFQSLFDSMEKEYPDKKIIIVYGCPGKKALGRRKELGDITGKHAALSIITEEDAGEESVQAISEEIARHVEAAGGKYEIIPDREEAIKTAIDKADEDTIILITGKGRETRQKRGIEYIQTPSDVDMVQKYLVSK
jgi:UDP-N-acetylmuramyl-tripeptide synthetase